MIGWWGPGSNPEPVTYPDPNGRWAQFWLRFQRLIAATFGREYRVKEK